MKIIRPFFELAYGEMRSLDYSLDEIQNFKRWLHKKIKVNEIEYDNIDDLIYDGLTEDDKERVRNRLIENIAQANKGRTNKRV